MFWQWVVLLMLKDMRNRSLGRVGIIFRNLSDLISTNINLQAQTRGAWVGVALGVRVWVMAMRPGGYLCRSLLGDVLFEQNASGCHFLCGHLLS